MTEKKQLTLDEAYYRLIGCQPSDEQIQELYRIREVLGLKPYDSLWMILMALQYHKDLYSQFPATIAEAAEKILIQFRETADAELKTSVESVKKSLSDAVVKSAEKVAAHVSKKSASRWMIAAAMIISAVTVCVGGAGFYFGDQTGFARGFAAAREEAAAASWAATPSGAAAYKMHLSGDLEKIVKCNQPGWEQRGDWCYPLPNQAETPTKTYGWKLP